MLDQAFKQAVYEECRQRVANRLQALQRALADLSESVANETKSTAGDKYETARAMLHIEQDGVRRQLAETGAQQAVLHAIDPAARTARVALGSLVRTGDTCYYLSAALGKLEVAGQNVVALSLQSPLGAQLRGKAAGEAVSLNCRSITILEVL